MFTPCCVRLVFVLCVTGSGLLADCVCTYVFVAVLEFVFVFLLFWFAAAVFVPRAAGLSHLRRTHAIRPLVWLFRFRRKFPLECLAERQLSQEGGGAHKHLRRACGGHLAQRVSLNGHFLCEARKQFA